MPIVVNKIFLAVVLILATNFTGAQINPGGNSHGTYICSYCDVGQAVANNTIVEFITSTVNPAHPSPWLLNDYVTIGDGDGNSSVWQRIGGQTGWSLVRFNGEDVGSGSSPSGGPNGPGEGGASSGGGPIWTGGGSGGTGGGGGGSSCHGVMVNNCVGDSCTATCQEF